MRLDNEVMYYIFLPVFYWASIYGVYKFAKYTALYECVKTKQFDPSQQIWLIVKYSIAFAFICWIIVDEEHQYGLVNHFLKLAMIFYFPSVCGVIMGYRKFPKMNEIDIVKFKKSLEAK